MDDDPIVPSRALQACLREMRTHVELFRLPGGHLAAPHVRSRRGEREPLPQQIVRWFIATQQASD